MNAPGIRALTAELRYLNEHFDGPAPVALTLDAEAFPMRGWALLEPGTWGHQQYGCETVPGDDRPFDAVAAARRLLAALRDAQGAR